VSDQINLSIGEAPWQPSHDSEVVLEFNHYDMPTAGVLSQAGCFYLFECLEGVADDFNIWAYTPLYSDEKDRLSTLAGSSLRQAMEGVWESRPATCALAVADQIQTGAVIEADVVREYGVLRATVRTITALLEREKSVSRALQDAASS